MPKIIVVDLMDEATRQKTALAFFNAAQNGKRAIMVASADHDPPLLSVCDRSDRPTV